MVSPLHHRVHAIQEGGTPPVLRRWAWYISGCLLFRLLASQQSLQQWLVYNGLNGRGMSWADFETQATVLSGTSADAVRGKSHLNESDNSSSDCIDASGFDDWQNFKSDSGVTSKTSGSQCSDHCTRVLKSCFDNTAICEVSPVSSSQFGIYSKSYVGLQRLESGSCIFCEHRYSQLHR